ncbi:MAG: RNA-binding S4 domain-containing protein [Candidatus Accumulibacter sp.]|uniref:RNA-binding S4 domain-containing protein n=1 Tax=Accumulibacter sp. TaxID=2053492 RepID=UPI001A51CFD7|nr:RNA-binding S4 domain-containing protein [Accumulibacter sp.]MBL8392163.1 RNA-binding S4 domain-containing protein [Accumulibacter sp.]HRD88776.1 RNA-binding S4 domain-containing protein [Accumulibacter sp.]
MPTEAPPQATMRIDKWLWVARFYRTRALAAQAVATGRVRLAGRAVKPASILRCGEEIEVNIGDLRWVITVSALEQHRRPASEARQLYEETRASRERRTAQLAARRLAPVPGSELGGRPTKKAGRLIRNFTDSE